MNTSAAFILPPTFDVIGVDELFIPNVLLMIQFIYR